MTFAQIAEKLPFPIAELGWDKFQQVMDNSELSFEDCVTVLKLALGEPDESLAAWPILSA